MVEIVVLDDDICCIEAIKDISRRHFGHVDEEYELRCHTDTEEFLNEMKERECDIILLDMELPGIGSRKQGKAVSAGCSSHFYYELCRICSGSL